MRLQPLFQIFSLSTAAVAAMLSPRSCGEGPSKVCFGRDGGTAQDIKISDLQYVANYLRLQAEDKEGMDAMFHMPAPDYGCAEWTLEIRNTGTVLALAKHISPRVNSTVHYLDMANAIDGGGDEATEESIKNSLLDCGTDGGMIGVKTNASAPWYNTDAYKASKAKPEGILIKLVRKPTN